MTDNQARLRTHLDRMGWTYQQLADWLTDIGDPVKERKVRMWMASPGSADYRQCPAWPALLIEAIQQKQNK